MSDLKAQIYDGDFYEHYAANSMSGATNIIPVALEILKPLRKINSVIDFGCGVGTWLSVYKENGVGDIIGVDGIHVNKNQLRINKDNFWEADLEQPQNFKRKFDLVNSIEVAEHISEKNSKQFVDSLCNHGDIILFSAAIPGQGGEHHVNEQFPSYWANLFAQNNYVCCDCIRKIVWDNKNINAVYKQNVMFFIEKSLIESIDNANFSPTIAPIDIIHPDAYNFMLLECTKHMNNCTKLVNKLSSIINIIRE